MSENRKNIYEADIGDKPCGREVAAVRAVVMRSCARAPTRSGKYGLGR